MKRTSCIRLSRGSLTNRENLKQLLDGELHLNSSFTSEEITALQPFDQRPFTTLHTKTENNIIKIASENGLVIREISVNSRKEFWDEDDEVNPYKFPLCENTIFKVNYNNNRLPENEYIAYSYRGEWKFDLFEKINIGSVDAYYKFNITTTDYFIDTLKDGELKRSWLCSYLNPEMIYGNIINILNEVIQNIEVGESSSSNFSNIIYTIEKDFQVATQEGETSLDINIPKYNKDEDSLSIFIDGVRLYPDIDYTIDYENSTINLTHPMYKDSEVYFYVLKNDTDNPDNNILYRYKTYTTTTDNETNIPIDLPDYKYRQDFLEVFINGLRLIENEDYTLNGLSSITLKNPASLGSEISFFLTRNIYTEFGSVVAEEDNVTEFLIPFDTYDDKNDILEVYINGIRLKDPDEYTSSKSFITLSLPVSLGTRVDFFIIKTDQNLNIRNLYSTDHFDVIYEYIKEKLRTDTVYVGKLYGAVWN